MRLAIMLCFVAGCFLPELTEGSEPAPADPCTECTSTACSAQLAACFDSSACAQVASCVFACDPSDEGCVPACLEGEQAMLGLDRALPLAECANMECVDSCPALTL